MAMLRLGRAGTPWLLEELGDACQHILSHARLHHSLVGIKMLIKLDVLVADKP